MRKSKFTEEQIIKVLCCEPAGRRIHPGGSATV